MNAKRKPIAALPASLSLLNGFVLLIALIPALLFSEPGHAQQKEFDTSKDGLIYPEKTMQQLKHIVDSLNLKFRTCELSKPYLAPPQARAHSVYLEGAYAEKAAGEMENGISFEDFCRRYPVSTITKDLLVVKFNYLNYEDKPEVAFCAVSFNDDGEQTLEFEENLAAYNKPVKGKWIIKKYEEAIRAFFFVEELTAKPLPLKYARQVQYSNCMVDTSTQIYAKNSRSGRGYASTESEKVKAFMKYVDKATNAPDYGKLKEKAYFKAMEIWEKERFVKLDALHQSDPVFKQLLTAAVADAVEKGGNHGEFETYVARYHNPKVALALKRGYRVIGGCSMDDSPRQHAREIARLAAETASWEIFLRSHLDLMNDRFERVSDGSYAWARRQTYIQELEALNINVTDLLLGISLRISDPASNHYYGSVGRVGRALVESKHAKEIESQMLQMIADPELDIYNRILIYYLFRHYNGHLESEQQQKTNIARLNTAVKSFPGYLAAQAFVKE